MATVTLKGEPTRLSGELPKVGSQAPDFLLVNQNLENVSMRDFSGKRKAILIVPSLDTSVCSTMAKKFNEAVASHPEACVLLVSADLPFAQKRFCGAEGVKNIHTLSMMRDKSFAMDYGVLIQEGPLLGICARAVLILDAEDKVVYTELVGEITSEPDYEQVLGQLLSV